MLLIRKKQFKNKDITNFFFLKIGNLVQFLREMLCNRSYILYIKMKKIGKCLKKIWVELLVPPNKMRRTPTKNLDP